MLHLVHRRLATIPLHPDTVAALEQLIRVDTLDLARQVDFAAIFTTIQAALAGDPERVAVFRAAWNLMYTAICRLDDLQDNDPVDHPLPVTGPTGAQYTFVFACSLLATGLLDELTPSVPAERALRLRRLWTDSLLRMADGQQRDLTADAQRPPSLDDYQALIQAKTGATFALAFGGTALLCTDDQAIVEALTAVGEIFGVLVQLSDDVLDAAEQSDAVATLPQVLRRLPLAAGHPDPPELAYTFWRMTLPAYRAAAAQILAQSRLPASAQQAVMELFGRAFAHPYATAR